ncbi:uncharacterized protein LOC112180138 [Rosa chinensis]|uniref:uncharacterized protein LOC112180138 n=1 Tax=Rosa chinensis TaxID=74649 RepID=UPI000D095B3B|nr:uncharacterized protein LOC112180138 [Rosa chinensis]
MAELVAGAGLGTVFTMLYDVVKECLVVGKFMQFKPLLGALKSTLDSIQPLIIQKIGEHNLKLGLPNDEIQNLEKQMREAEKLVVKLSKLRMWNRIKSRYTDQLVELDGTLKRLLKQVLMQQARDVKENLMVAKETAQQLVEMQEFNERLLKERTLQQEEAIDLQHKFVSALQNNAKQLVHLQGVIEEMMKQQEAREVTDAGTGYDLEKLFNLLYESVQRVMVEHVTYKPMLQSIECALDSLQPLVKVTKKPSGLLLDRLKEDLEVLRIQMQNGMELLRKCAKIGTWNIYKRFKYANKLIQWEESLRRQIDILYLRTMGRPITV